tara:strand:+ start:223 stop:591 length:369 start_codon:yes stop_codon:yes gene_type:complete
MNIKLADNYSLKLTLAVLSILSSSLAHAYDPYDCIGEAAAVDPNINKGLVTELCSAAWSPEPARCYAAVSLVDADMPRGLAVELCAGSEDASRTIDCYANMGEYDLNRGLTITLCSASKNKN